MYNGIFRIAFISSYIVAGETDCQNEDETESVKKYIDIQKKLLYYANSTTIQCAKGLVLEERYRVKALVKRAVESYNGV